MTQSDTCELYLPLLKALSDGKPRSIAALPDKTGQIYCVLPDDLGIREPQNGSCDYLEKILHAGDELAKACLITKTGENICQITDRGREVLNSGVTRLETTDLMKYPEYRRR